MATFTYRALGADGGISEGRMEAKDAFDLGRQLKQGGGRLLSYEEKKEGKGLLNIKFEFFGGVKTSEKIIFTRNIAAMVSAGLALSRALDILERQTNNPEFKKVLFGLGDSIKKGISLSDAMKEHPKVFSSLFVSMVHAGEESGKLADALLTVGKQTERSYMLEKKVKGALIYPGIIITAMLVVGILMLIYVVPTLTNTFKELDVELPASTQFIIFVSDAFANHTLLVFSILGALGFGGFTAARTKRGRRIFDYIVTRIPLIGMLVQKTNSARTARTLSSLLSSGVDVLQAIGITRDVIQNSYYKDLLGVAGERVQKGGTLSSAFIEAPHLYPLILGEMVAVGEETGRLSDMLREVADFYENDVEEATKSLSTIIEPVLMIVVGVGVGFFAMSMITPTYSLLNSI